MSPARRRAIPLAGAVLACGLAAALQGGCAASGAVEAVPPPRRACSGELERAARTAALLDGSWPVRGGGAALGVIRSIAQTLALHAPRPSAAWSFLLLDDDRLNAFSVGGGRIYVSRGTVSACHSEAELAAVIAHEMAHDLAGHFCAPSSAQSAGLHIGRVRQRLDPALERAADAASLSLLAGAGYDPHAALAMVRRVEGGGDGDLDRAPALAAALEAFPEGGRADSAAFRALRGAPGGSTRRRNGMRRSVPSARERP